MLGCILPLAGASTSIILGATNVLSCLSRQTCVRHDKTRLLSRRKYACRDKGFLATKLCATKRLSFVATSILLPRQKTCFVATKHLSQQKLYFWQLPPVIVYKFLHSKTDSSGVSLVPPVLAVVTSLALVTS